MFTNVSKVSKVSEIALMTEAEHHFVQCTNSVNCYNLTNALVFLTEVLLSHTLQKQPLFL